MFNTFLKNHQYKLILGAPIIFLVIINSAGTLGVGNIFFFTHAVSNFIVVGDDAEVTLAMRTKAPINAVGGTVTMTPALLEMTSLSRISSVVDLWSEEPAYTKEENVLRFSGGMIGEKTETPLEGAVFVMHLSALKEGVATVSMRGGQLLASNGVGTNIISGSNALTLYIRAKGSPSPDINDDGVLSLLDVNTLYLKTFRTYDQRYDLNDDGRVSFADVRVLVGLF
jgi:hypothetical protein